MDEGAGGRPFDVVVATHGTVGDALLSAAEMICGASEGVTALSLAPEDSPEAFASRLSAALDPGRPTLVLTDMFGGTPHNVAAAAGGGSEIRSIAGVNLGMLIEAITASDALDDALVERLAATGRDSVVVGTARPVLR